MTKFLSLTALLLIGSIQTIQAQFGFSHELGLIAGPVAFQSLPEFFI